MVSDYYTLQRREGLVGFVKCLDGHQLFFFSFFLIIFIYPGLQFKHYSLVSHRAPACNLDIAEHGNILITRTLLEN